MRECFICHGRGTVLDRRETRLTGFNCYVDCTCSSVSRGWRKVMANKQSLRDDAVKRFEQRR